MNDMSVSVPLFSVAESVDLINRCQRGALIFSAFIGEAKQRLIATSSFYGLPMLLLFSETDTVGRPFGKESLLAKLYGIQPGLMALSLDSRIDYHAHLSGFLTVRRQTLGVSKVAVQTYFIPRVPGVSADCEVFFSWNQSTPSSVLLTVNGCGITKVVSFSGERAERLRAFLLYFSVEQGL